MNASTVSPSAATAPNSANIQLLQLTTACWTSRCLHIIAELGVADAIDDRPQTTEVLAKATGTQPQALYRVLRLLASVGIFEWNHGAWHHTEASRFLRSDHPGSLRDYVRMLGLPVIWCAFGDLDHSLRTGESAFAKRHAEGVFGYLAKHPEESRIFDAAMTSKSHRDIPAIVPAYDFSQFATIADIAGGRGHLLRAILKSSPKTRGNPLRSAARGRRGRAGKRGEALGGRRRFLRRRHTQSGRLPVDEYHPRLGRRGIHQNPVRYPARHANARQSVDHRDRRPTNSGASSLEGTRYRHDGAPRRHGAHSGGIRRLGLKMCAAMEVYGRDHESIFHSRNGRRLKRQVPLVDCSTTSPESFQE